MGYVSGLIKRAIKADAEGVGGGGERSVRGDKRVEMESKDREIMREKQIK